MTTPVRFDKAKDVIVGIGIALVDILTHEDDAFVEKTGFGKGGMNLVDSDLYRQNDLPGVRYARCCSGWFGVQYDHRCGKAGRQSQVHWKMRVKMPWGICLTKICKTVMWIRF